ncbi:hypothetical protein JZ751_015753 [Albula glossodonta]|uniref:Lymphocyte antigen 86 n=1 Tax=Albula glossodonta TaxID=121402 RepID=A0A8T2MS97_9TELE|nr:hypothetical protein JZ751_015753 [Albula glossodonta]
MRALVLLLLGASFSLSVNGNGQRWPIHSLCNTSRMQVYYSSCDPIQDVGLSVSRCPVSMVGEMFVTGVLLLRQSVDELYLSLDVSYNGNHVLHYDLPVCERHFPRISSCGRKRGEMVSQEVRVNEDVAIPKVRVCIND